MVEDHLALPHMEGAEMRSIQFRSGSPKTGEDLFSSAEEPSVAERLMNENLEIVLNAKESTFKVVGWSADNECSGAGCDALALLRAKIVTEWLMAHGVPKGRLGEPRAGGLYFGHGYVPSDLERNVARHADIEIVPAGGLRAK